MAGTAGRTDATSPGKPAAAASPRALPCGRSRGPYCAPSVGRRLPFGCPLTTATGMGPIVCPIPVAVCPPTADHIRIHIIYKVGWVAYRTIFRAGALMSEPPGKGQRTRQRGTHPHVFLRLLSNGPHAPEGGADSAGVSVGVKLEPKDRLISCRKCWKPLDFPYSLR